MEEALNALGFELIVDDLDRAVELFADVLGCALLSRGPSALVAGETATIDAGPIVISLLAPASSGPGTVLAERTPRLSQIVFGASASSETERLMLRATEAGLAVALLGEVSFHITPESVEGALGIPVAAVVTTIDAPEG